MTGTVCQSLLSCTCDRLSSIGDVEVVGARLIRDVLNTAAAVFIISAGHLGLGWTLHGQTQTTSAGSSAKKLMDILNINSICGCIKKVIGFSLLSHTWSPL